MKLKNRAETAVTIILAGVCLVLIIRLMVRVRAVGAAAPATVTPISTARPAASLKQRGLRRVAEALPEGPFLNVDLYQQLQAHPLPAPDRDPFAFAPTPEQIQAAGKAREAAGTARNGPAAPPAPPPLPFAAVGYSQTAAGQLEAYLAGNQTVYAVREGGQLENRYRVVKITPAMIEISDELLGRTAELPFPQ